MTRPLSKSRTTAPVGVEALDSPALDRTTARATLNDIARANLLLGGHAAVRHGVMKILDMGPHPHTLTILDVGAGAGDVLASLTRRLASNSIAATGIAVDWHREAAVMALERSQLALVGDATKLPVEDQSVDVVVASQLLHHFSRSAGIELLRELDRVARVGVVIADIRRAQIAAWGIWLAASILRFHQVSRTDGVISVQRGFSSSELAEICRVAGVTADVQRHPGFRLVASWRTDRAYGRSN